MKNTKRFSILAAIALSLVVTASAFIAPTLSFANEEKHDEHGHDHDKEGHEDHEDHSHDKH